MDDLEVLSLLNQNEGFPPKNFGKPTCDTTLNNHQELFPHVQQIL